MLIQRFIQVVAVKDMGKRARRERGKVLLTHSHNENKGNSSTERDREPVATKAEQRLREGGCPEGRWTAEHMAGHADAGTQTQSTQATTKS